jgi:hypothetical protein
MKQIVGAILSVILFMGSAEAVVVCQKGSKVKLRPAVCKGREIRVLDLSASTADAQSLQGLTAQQLIDQAVAQAGNAQTLQGLTPANIAAAASADAQSRIGAALVGFLDSAYSRLASIAIPAGFCNCVSAQCDGPSDFLVSCGGGTLNDGTGMLTKVSELAGAGGVCEACACTTGVLSTGVAVSATCLSP